MSSYTMQLKTYIEKFSQGKENLSTDERIEIGRKHLFDFDYPIYNENYRKDFETNFIYEFYMREIGFETEGLFKMRLRNWLNKNMGYYNKLFESELFKYDPLTNSRMKVIHSKANDKKQTDSRNIEQDSSTHGKGSADSTQNSSVNNSDDRFERVLNSDTPQNRLQITTNDGDGVIEYASSMTENKSKNNSDSVGSVENSSNDSSEVNSNAKQMDNLDSIANELEEFSQEREGKIGVQSYSKLVNEYRNALIRVEVMIHEEMQELFMLVY